MIEYKTLTYKDDRHGQKQLESDLNRYAKSGWRLQDTGSRVGKHKLGTAAAVTLALGPVGLLAGFRRKKGKITAILERDI